MAKPRPIIVIKKRIGGHGAHGGAWKVAYADFVTALMAFFIVLWLMNANNTVRQAVAGYFRDPAGTTKQTGSGRSGAADYLSLTKDDMPKLKEELENTIHHELKDFDKLKNQIEITITPEGLRIELLETEKGTFFNLGNPVPNETGKNLLVLLAQVLGQLPNKISIEGHTDSKPYSGIHEYSNWELSTDRAHAARRLMQANGLGPGQVSQVRGYADQMLRKPENPLDASNRRISVIVHYINSNENGPD